MLCHPLYGHTLHCKACVLILDSTATTIATATAATTTTNSTAAPSARVGNVATLLCTVGTGSPCQAEKLKGERGDSPNLSQELSRMDKYRDRHRDRDRDRDRRRSCSPAVFRAEFDHLVGQVAATGNLALQTSQEEGLTKAGRQLILFAERDAKEKCLEAPKEYKDGLENEDKMGPLKCLMYDRITGQIYDKAKKRRSH